MLHFQEGLGDEILQEIKLLTYLCHRHTTKRILSGKSRTENPWANLQVSHRVRSFVCLCVCVCVWFPLAQILKFILDHMLLNFDAD